MRFSTFLFGALLAGTAAPALAQYDTAPPPPIKLSGGVTLTSDYRFRGLTQTNEDPAVQATLTLTSLSGFYGGVWTSTIDGGRDGSTPALTGYGDAEVDLYGGWSRTFNSGLGVDAGLVYYLYPDRASGLNTDYFEPYASLSYTIGPITAKAGANYAWGGQSALDLTSGSDDNLYLYGEASSGIPGTPLSVRAHLGHSSGALGRVNLDAGDDDYWDWSLTTEAVGGPLRVGVSYVDTDITDRGGFDQRLGRGSTVLGYVGYSF